MEYSVHKIAILTSGGDSPGMNAAVRAVVRSAIDKGLEAYFVYDGYYGLVNNMIEKCNRDSVTNIINRGGTIIGSARLPEFKEDSVAQKGVDNLKKLGIDALVVIGGDGSYQGARKLSHMGINCVGLPGTIDNDIASSEFTIGYDTAVNTAVEAIDRLRDTITSHKRCSIVEVMGRYCADIAYAAGIAAGCDMVIASEQEYDEDKVVELVNSIKNNRHIIICVAEHVTDVNALAKTVQAKTGYETRGAILGHIQRGGNPTPFDRILATRLGDAAVEKLCEGQTSICLGVMNNQVVATPIDEALQMKKNVFPYASKLVNTVK